MGEASATRVSDLSPERVILLISRVIVARASTLDASLAQLVEHALRKRTVVGSIPTGGSPYDDDSMRWFL